MERIFRYFKDAYYELVNKVSWPTWKELQSSAMVVMIASLLIALVIAVMDLGSKSLFSDFLYKLG
jgi:preprotein translocase subunit SecE